VTSTSSSSMHSELREAVEAFKTKAETYRIRLEETEIDKVKLARTEAMRACAISIYNFVLILLRTVRRSLADAEESQLNIVNERDGVMSILKNAEIKIQELEARLEQGNQETTDMDILRKRLAEEMDNERKQYQKDLEERDFANDQTRKKYQGMCSEHVKADGY
jgi:myosin heavy chain 9/10/11/14